MEYEFVPTLSLALFDFIPCILYVIAFVYLLRFTRRNTSKTFYYLMMAGMFVVEIGALSKAMWKLLNAVADINLIELSNYAMYFISVGTLLTFIVVVNMALEERKYHSSYHTTTYTLPFYIPAIILLSLSTSGYLICLIMMAFTRRTNISVYMLTIYLILTFVMAGFTPNGSSEITHWVCQAINTVGTLAFVIGTYSLDKADYLIKQEKKVQEAS